MERLDVDSNFGQIAETIENHYTGQPSLPPEGHPNSRVCPQCQTTTWRMTQHCLRCGLDLFKMDRQARQMRRVRQSMFFFLLAMLTFYGQSHVASETVRLWLMAGGLLSILVAGALTKD